MKKIVIVMGVKSVTWFLSDDAGLIDTDTQTLKSANDCYDSLLSNVVNHCSGLVKNSEIEWTFRKSP